MSTAETQKPLKSAMKASTPAKPAHTKEQDTKSVGPSETAVQPVAAEADVTGSKPTKTPKKKTKPVKNEAAVEKDQPKQTATPVKPKRAGALSNFSAWSDMCKKHGQTGVVTKKNPKYEDIKKEYDQLKAQQTKTVSK